MYYHNLYFWADEDKAYPVHLARYKHIPALRWTEELYQQARPLYRYPKAISIRDFAPLRRYKNEMISRHIGITDSLLWQHTLGTWWLEDEEPKRYQIYTGRRIIDDVVLYSRALPRG